MGFFNLFKTKRRVSGWRKRNGITKTLVRKTIKEGVRRYKASKKNVTPKGR